MILKWFAELEQADRRARASTCRASTWRRSRTPTACPRARSTGREELAEALRAAIAVDDGPRLVQVPVASRDVARLSVSLLRSHRSRRHAHSIAPEPAPAPDRAPDWVARGTPEPLRSELLAELGPQARRDARARPRALRLGREPLPLDPEGGRDTARRGRRRAAVRARAPHGDAARVPRGRNQPQRPVADRRHPRRRSPPLAADRHRGGRAAACGSSRVPCSATSTGASSATAGGSGPDPASTDIACVGGVIANNSGGMRCGVHADSYRTLRSLTFVLANGAVIDTAEADAEERFAAGGARARARASPSCARRCAPTRSCASGSNASSRSRTRPATACARSSTPTRRSRSSGGCSSARRARSASSPRRSSRRSRSDATPPPACGCSRTSTPPSTRCPSSSPRARRATELMVAPTLIAAAWNMPGTPERWKELEPHNAALLVELRGESPEELEGPERAAAALLSARSPLDATAFTREREHTEMLWRVREGMQGLLAAIRAPGVTMIVEDVCVPPARVGEAAKDLQRLLGAHGFLPGVAGHASAGQPALPADAQLRRAGRPGPLRGLHARPRRADRRGVRRLVEGRARHRASTWRPYVEREWGAKATEMMWRVKQLADPDGILAPGVVLTRDEGAHLRNLKSAPVIEAVATQCIECGFCEPVCPSRDLTTTPRQRIALRREMARQRARLARPARRCSSEYEYDAIQTCAADGTCSLACPVGIDTGALVKQLARAPALRARRAHRARARTPLRRRGARGARRAAGGARAAKASRRAAWPRCARAATSDELVPDWPQAMPAPAAARLPATSRTGAAAVYFPACVNRIFGNGPRGRRRTGRAPGARRRVRAGRAAAVDPRRRRRPLLRPALELQGLRRRPRAHGEQDRRRAPCAGPTPGGCRSSSTRARARTA